MLTIDFDAIADIILTMYEHISTFPKNHEHLDKITQIAFGYYHLVRRFEDVNEEFDTKGNEMFPNFIIWSIDLMMSESGWSHPLLDAQFIHQLMGPGNVLECSSRQHLMICPTAWNTFEHQIYSVFHHLMELIESIDTQADWVPDQFFDQPINQFSGSVKE